MKIIVFSVGSDCEKYIEKHMLSVQKQKFIKSPAQIIHIIIDDGSQDNTSILIQKYIINTNIFETITYRNENKIGWLASANKYLNLHIDDPDDIIVPLDLYDCFSSPISLSTIHEKHHETECWITYGSFSYSNSLLSLTEKEPFPRGIMELRNYRQLNDDEWRLWRPITFRAFLWLNIDIKDLQNKSREFFTGVYDKIIGYPLLEMVSLTQIKYIRDILYIQNDENLYNSKNGYPDNSFRHYPLYPILPENYLKKVNIELDSKKITSGLYKKIKQEIFRSFDDQFFIIFSCGYNCMKYISEHMKMVKEQDYKNYVHIIVDDASTDETSKEIEKYKDDKTIHITNYKNYKWLKNSMDHLKPRIKNQESIIVVLDLDDCFSNDTVLSKLNNIYKSELCWVTYGSYKTQSTGIIVPREDHSKEYTSFRNGGWNYSHPKTFKSFLFDRINPIDFQCKGAWIKYSYDRFLMYPILEMTPKRKIRYIKDVLVTYNSDNPLSVYKTNKMEQRKFKNISREMTPYEIYERLEENES